ncbi:hypothetical protein LINPERPRIM_LOCUS8405 [Linum perenne]
MFRPVRWRNDKNKFKVVFKFQFHATQVSELKNVESLVVSLVPGDVGKPTGRSDKAAIREGSCRWEFPVYETVKFSRDSKTGKITDKSYYFIVSTGSLKSSIVGEALIDLAAYAEAAKASIVSLPLKNSKTSGVLHVTIQKLQSNLDQREEEETEAVNIKARNNTLNTLLSSGESDEGINSFPKGDVLHSADNIAEKNGISTVTSGSDITLSSCGSSSGLIRPTENGSTLFEDGQPRTQCEWSVDSDQGMSVDGSTNSSLGTLTGEKSQQISDVEVEKLKAELVTMARQLDLSDLELQTLRKQVVKESRRGQDLLRELLGMKEEKDAIHAECEKLKGFQKGMDDARSENKLKSQGGDPWFLVGEFRQELYYEKNRNANLQLQLQKTQESNAELLLAVRELEELWKEKGTETSEAPASMKSLTHPDASQIESDEDDEDQKALEELVKEHTDTRETYILEQRITDLTREIEMYRRDKDELEMQMEQLALDYEISKQENHDLLYKVEQSQLQEQLEMQYECSPPTSNENTLDIQIERMEDELKEQRIERSISLTTIQELQDHIKIVEQELKLQEERMLQHECSPANANTEELEGQIERLENELKKQQKDYSGSLDTINELQNHIKSLEEEAKLQESSILQHEAAVANTKELKGQIKRLENELKEQQNEYTGSLTTINELQIHIKSLEIELKMQQGRTLQDESAASANTQELEAQIERLGDELKKQQDQNSGLLATIKELETHISSMEDELEQQSQSFEADLETITGERVKQEQKAIQAEEALRLTRWKNSNKAEKLQEEFRKLSMQMASTFEANEKVAMKALAECSQVRIQKSQLEDMLLKANSELKNAKDDYKEKLLELSNQLNLKTNQVEKLLIEIDDKSKQLKCQKQHEEQLGGTFTQKIHKLQVEIENVVRENNVLSIQVDQLKNVEVELEEMKQSIKNHEELVQKGNAERNELVNTVALLKKEAEKSAEDLNTLRSLNKEKETALRTNNSEAASNFREKVKLLEVQMKSKETAFETSVGSFMQKERDLMIKIEELEQKVVGFNQCCANVTGNLHLKLDDDSMNVADGISRMDSEVKSELKSFIVDDIDSKVDELAKELLSVKERNEEMGSELMEMQERYSEISLKFAEVEGERQKLLMTVRSLKNARKELKH